MPGFELIGKAEKDQLIDLMDNSGILFRHGFEAQRNNIFKVKEFEKDFQSFMKTKNSLAVSSGTSALLVALKGLDIKKGDEIITQAFTFVATVEAIVEAGATPVICDINETLNIDPDEIERLITEKTKAIIVVHMLGMPCELDKILEIAKKHDLKVIEDTAWGCGGKYHNQYLGTIGDAGTYSFDFAKTITTGEGGMVVFQKHNDFNRAAAYHDHGHENNPDLPRWKDSRTSSGFNYRMTEMQGAIGIAQLRKLEYIVDSQRKNYFKVQEIISKKGYKIREEPSNSYSTCDALVFFCDSNSDALKIRERLVQGGISTKILPEAITWHFAGDWNHIPEIKANNDDKKFLKSRTLLEKAVSIPISVKMADSFFEILEKAL